ncbi:MAG: aldehyde dehydrogenase [bacterium]|nr:aldehyde dehydrogenase [bacterium]
MEPSKEQIKEAIQEQRIFFATHKTKEISFRLNQLKKLKESIKSYETKIAEALWLDLHKSPEEAYLTETGLVLQELDLHIKKLSYWSQDKHMPTPLFLWPSTSKILFEPLGLALIISPWNYPFQLLMNPLVGAISAGCCAVLKPSPDALNLAKVVEEIIAKTFDSNYISLFQGDIETNQVLLAQRFDIIFFTGSTRVGKIVMKAAAEHLTPVVLELGGKSPAIVDKHANLALAAKRIIWGKTINAGQTCIAPDYLFVQEEVKELLMIEMGNALQEMFGSDPKKSDYYGRIVHERAYQRLLHFLSKGKAIIGGEVGDEALYISPTILDGLSLEDDIMQEEIFGPILPIFTFKEIQEVTDYLQLKEKPLTLYYFGNKQKASEILNKTSSGGACINDTLMHVSNHHLPFGGVGNSGMGSYHGKKSFLAFSHAKPVVSTPTWIDLPFKYAPFRYFKWIKKLL